MKTVRHRTTRGLTRRQFVGGAGAAAGAFSLDAVADDKPDRAPTPAPSPATAPAATVTVEGYASSTSVAQGGSLALHLRATSGTGWVQVPLTISRMAQPDVLMLRATVRVRNESVPADASTTGCGWPVSYQLAVPSNWPSGLYYAFVGTGSTGCVVPFVVRAARPGATSAVLVQVPAFTRQAYNNWGGKSLYDFNSTQGVRAAAVSFDRPDMDRFNFAFDRWQAPWVRWLAKNGIAAEFCTSADVHLDPTLLGAYRLMVAVGHDEYVSRTMRERLDAFVAGGGNLAILGGNTSWFQVRLEGSRQRPNRKLVCYKSANADPTQDPTLKTVNWIDLSPAWPENTTYGLGSRRGAAWTNAAPRPDTPFIAQRSGHWLFEGTNLSSRSSFAGAWVGYETGACDFAVASDGTYHPAGTDGTPAGLRILAQADATGWDAAAKALGYPGETSGWASMSLFSRGAGSGTVFNTGSTDWVYGLKPELEGLPPSVVSRITLNLLNKLSAAHTEPADVRVWRGPLAGGGTRQFLTTGFDAPAGTTLDGTGFAAHLQWTDGLLAVFRYRRARPNGDGFIYLYSTVGIIPASTGWINEQASFYAYPTAGPNTVPVYQHHEVLPDGQFNYAYTTQATPALGWVNDGAVFHALPA